MGLTEMVICEQRDERAAGGSSDDTWVIQAEGQAKAKALT